MRLREITCLLLIACGSAHADVSDPPARVARIKSTEGVTTIQDAGAATFAPVTNNWPVAPGDQVRTNNESRAELDFGDSRLVLESSSELKIEGLDPATIKLRVTAGIADIDASNGTRETITLQLAHATIQIAAPGSFRIEVQETGDAWMTVHRGEAQIRTGQVVFEQRSDEEVAIARDGTFAIAPAAPKDSRRSARRSEAVRIARHVAPALAGWQDLDDYGRWRWIPQYGMVWEPLRVSVHWAPYRFGRWIWKSPWGWTWVDDAPWGFAPFHFGRWAYIGTRWLWVPGPRQIPVAYAPALVRWVQPTNERESVGWYPLAPGEEYVPPYPASDPYKRSINVFTVVRGTADLTRLASIGERSAAGLTWAAREEFALHPPPHTE
jgi:hypothetical protein